MEPRCERLLFGCLGKRFFAVRDTCFHAQLSTHNFPRATFQAQLSKRRDQLYHLTGGGSGPPAGVHHAGLLRSELMRFSNSGGSSRYSGVGRMS